MARWEVSWGLEAESGVELSLHPLQAGARPSPRLLEARLGEQVGPQSASWAVQRVQQAWGQE